MSRADQPGQENGHDRKPGAEPEHDEDGQPALHVSLAFRPCTILLCLRWLVNDFPNPASCYSTRTRLVDCLLSIADCGLLTADCRLLISDCRLLTADC